MTNKTFSVPAIGCAGCVRSIKLEVGQIAGVTAVQGDENTKVVSVSWEAPATWEQIAAALVEIEYPAVELMQP